MVKDDSNEVSLLDIPQAIISEGILTYLDAIDLSRIACVSKDFHSLVDFLVQRLLKTEYKIRIFGEPSKLLYFISYKAPEGVSKDRPEFDEEKDQKKHFSYFDQVLKEQEECSPRSARNLASNVPYEKSKNESWTQILYLADLGFFKRGVLKNFPISDLFLFPRTWKVGYLEKYDDLTTDEDLDKIPEEAKYVVIAAINLTQFTTNKFFTVESIVDSIKNLYDCKKNPSDLVQEGIQRRDEGRIYAVAQAIRGDDENAAANGENPEGSEDEELDPQGIVVEIELENGETQVVRLRNAAGLTAGIRALGINNLALFGINGVAGNPDGDEPVGGAGNAGAPPAENTPDPVAASTTANTDNNQTVNTDSNPPEQNENETGENGPDQGDVAAAEQQFEGTHLMQPASESSETGSLKGAAQSSVSAEKKEESTTETNQGATTETNRGNFQIGGSSSSTQAGSSTDKKSDEKIADEKDKEFSKGSLSRKTLCKILKNEPRGLCAWGPSRVVLKETHQNFEGGETSSNNCWPVYPDDYRIADNEEAGSPTTYSSVNSPSTDRFGGASSSSTIPANPPSNESNDNSQNDSHESSGKTLTGKDPRKIRKGSVYWYRWTANSFGFSGNPHLFLWTADARLAFGMEEADSASRLSWNLDYGFSSGGWRAGEAIDLGEKPDQWYKIIMYRL